MLTVVLDKSDNHITDVALIFEGGGMRASYTSAAVVTLLAENLHFDWVGGISAGASNTVNYLSRDPERAKKSFVEFVADPRFGSLATFMRGEGWFDAHYIYEETAQPGQALPFDFATFVANPAQRRIGAFQADTGREVYWGKEDLVVPEEIMRRVRASSTMPILMPPVRIDEHVYVDGALGPSGGIALDAARADGFTRFFVVLSQPRGYVKRPQKLMGTFRRYFRNLPAAADALANRYRNYNRTREELFDLEASGDAYLFVPTSMNVGNSTTNVAKLQASYDAGLAQARSEAPAWRDWLGLPPTVAPSQQ